MAGVSRPLTKSQIVEAQKITLLIDVRTIPRSRHNPQYGQEALRDELEAHGIHYVYMKNLGGLRPKSKTSTNPGWHNESFRNYADYMQTPAFTDAIGELLTIAKERTVAIMCAEAVPWRCHRSLIGDALLVRGITVLDIMTEKSTKPHELTSFAKVDGTRVRYPATSGDDPIK